MKVWMKPIEMIAWFNQDSMPIPLRYRIILKDGTQQVVQVDKVIHKEEEKIAGNRMIVYRCESVINNLQRIYELKYEIDNCKWFLFKI